MTRLIFVVFLLFFSCAPSSSEDFREKGAAKSYELTKELREIQTRADLKAALPKLRRGFLELAELLLEAREFRAAHPGASVSLPTKECDELFAELSRLYELPEGRDLIESSQIDAVKKLL